MVPDSGNIRVFVRWDSDSAVLGGEELKATICFKNIAAAGPTSLLHSQLKPPPTHHRAANSHPSSRLAPPPTTPTTSSRRGHRPSSSLSVSEKTTRTRGGSIPWIPASHPPEAQQNNGHGNGNSHARSVSIVSIGSATSADSQATSTAGSSGSRPRIHGRSSSLQIGSRSPRSSWSLCICNYEQ